MLINVKMPAIVGILTFMSMIDFVLSWVEHGKGFITSGLSWVNKSIESPENIKKIWDTVQRPQSKSICFYQTSTKRTCLIHVLRVLKRAVSVRRFLATKTYVWLDYNITMMCDACVVGTQRNSLGETVIESPKYMFGSITHSKFYLVYLVCSTSTDIAVC